MPTSEQPVANIYGEHRRIDGVSAFVLQQRQISLDRPLTQPPPPPPPLSTGAKGEKIGGKIDNASVSCATRCWSENLFIIIVNWWRFSKISRRFGYRGSWIVNILNRRRGYYVGLFLMIYRRKIVVNIVDREGNLGLIQDFK